MNVVDKWTGRDACNLQKALRMTNETFAARLGIAVRTVATWHDRPGTVPRAEMQQILDVTLTQAPPAARTRFDRLAGDTGIEAAQVFHAALAVVVNDTDVLLVCRRDAGAGSITWQFPAGVVKPGASPETVAVRETLAETGVHCAARRALGERVHPVTGVLCHYLLCDYLAGTPENRDPQENASALWVPRTDLTRFIPADLIFLPVREALEV